MDQVLFQKSLKTFLHSRGIATSRTSAYNPRGNGQVERYNGVIWKAISLALESRGLNQCHWEQVLSDALHSIRSLLCTATNCTPHERLFGYQRRSSSGHSVPSWLSSSDRAYLRKKVRESKFDPLVEEVEIVHVNPEYAHVRLPSGIESTVSARDLAPMEQPTPNTHIDINTQPTLNPQVEQPNLRDTNIEQQEQPTETVVPSSNPEPSTVLPNDQEPTSNAPRKSNRTSKKPLRLIEQI